MVFRTVKHTPPGPNPSMDAGSDCSDYRLGGDCGEGLEVRRMTEQTGHGEHFQDAGDLLRQPNSPLNEVFCPLLVDI